MTKRNKTNLINLRIWSELKKTLQAKADAHTNGNISEWLRVSGSQYIPPPKKTIPS